VTGPSSNCECVPATSRPFTPTRAEDEAIYVVAGAITAIVGDQRIDVDAGSYAALPKNLPHSFIVRRGRGAVAGHPGAGGRWSYFFVPRDDGDADPARFGLIIHEGCRSRVNRATAGDAATTRRPQAVPGFSAATRPSINTSAVADDPVRWSRVCVPPPPGHARQFALSGIAIAR